MTAAGDDRADPQAITAAFTECSAGLHSFLTGLLRDPHAVQEVQQSTFVKALERGDSVDPTKFRGWLFRVANNEALQLLRRRKAQQRVADQLAIHNEVRTGSTGSRDPVVAEVCSRELVQRVQQCLQQLPPEQQEVVRLRIYEGLKFTEIANQTAAPLGTVLTRMRLALKRLAKSLPNDDQSQSQSHPQS